MESFRTLLDTGAREKCWSQEHLSANSFYDAGVPAFSLSDEKNDFQVNDKRSFLDLIVFAVMNDKPETTLVAFLKGKYLCEVDVSDDLFGKFEANHCD